MTSVMKRALRGLVKDVLEQADGKWNKAEELLLKRLKRNAVLRSEVIKWACRELVRQVSGHNARTVRRSAEQRHRPAGVDRGLLALKEERKKRRRMWLEYPLMDGLYLQFATKAKLVYEASFRRKQAAGNLLVARWMESIIRAMGEAGTVGEALSNEELDRLYQEALGEQEKEALGQEKQAVEAQAS